MKRAIWARVIFCFAAIASGAFNAARAQDGELLPVAGMDRFEVDAAPPVNEPSAEDNATQATDPEAKAPEGETKEKEKEKERDEAPSVLVESRVSYRAKFRFESAEEVDISEARARAASMRVGLVFQKPNGVFVPLQRGTLRSCVNGNCAADFADNEQIRRYAKNFRLGDNLYITFLQTARLRERLVELSRKNDKKKSVHYYFLTVGGGMRPYEVDEQSTTPFNAAKRSQKVKYGYLYFADAQYDSVFIRYEASRIALATAQFFGDVGNTYVKESFLSGGFDSRLFNWIPWTQFRVYAGQLSSSFVTDNDDEAILSSVETAVLVGTRFSFDLPYFLNGTPQSNFRVGVGSFHALFEFAVKTSLKDQGEFQRGPKADHNLKRFGAGYEIATFHRTSRLLGGWALGFTYLQASYDSQFSGTPVAPEGVPGVEPNTAAIGKETSWHIYLKKTFAF